MDARRRLSPTAASGRSSPTTTGGWSTLSFIPTLATMMLGLWSRQWLKSARSSVAKLKGPIFAGVALAAAGILLQALHLCPIVKRIWTSSYTLYSGGLVILMLAGFYAAIEVKRAGPSPCLVIGASSMATYLMSWTMEEWVRDARLRHVGAAPVAVLGAPFEPVLRGLAELIVCRSMLFWMYRRRIFVRI